MNNNSFKYPYSIDDLLRNKHKLKKELTQQENNLLFFNDKSKENKLLKSVHLKIENQKLEIEKIINTKKKLLK